MLDMTCHIGVVAPGAFADIVAVNGDPLRDINVLGAVTFVMKDGGVFKNEVK
jgi:imidazolonepropionase-like amidohydrolase